MHLFTKMPLPPHFVDAMSTSWLEGKGEMKIGVKMPISVAFFYVKSIITILHDN